MGKVFCFIIALLMLLGSASSLIASGIQNGESSCFEEFVTDQIYKSFSATISAKQAKSSESPAALFTDALNAGSQFNFSDNRYSDDNKTILRNYESCCGAVLFYCDIWRHRTRHCGLSEYIMNLNSFIAVSTVSDAIVYYKAV